MQTLRIAELFAGIGGVTGGFLDAGAFDAVFLHDSDYDAQTTFVRNFPRLAHRYHGGLVERLTAPQLIDLAGGSIDGLLGCPPCQGFSAAGSRDEDDERNYLLHHFARLVKGTDPKFFVLENVPGLLRSTLYEEFEKGLVRKYRLQAEVVNVAEYGVPQLRRRAVVIGFHRDLQMEPSMPEPTHGDRGMVFDYYTGTRVWPRSSRGRRLLRLRPYVELGLTKLVTLQEALGDLPADLAPGEEARTYSKPPSTRYQKLMRDGAQNLANHKAWTHSAKMVRFMEGVSPGNCPSKYGCRSRNAAYFSQAYSRLHKDGLARTITTNFHNPGSGRYTHYAAPRTLTVREALRIQGFPDDFSFNLEDLSPTDAERLVGNAFPRLFAAAIARHIRDLLVR
jgi:DNA (cytosine-5)-methyltransferase 1